MYVLSGCADRNNSVNAVRSLDLMRYTVLVRNNDFRRVYAKGKAYVGFSLVLYVIKNRAGKTRVGITSSKKIGNAVQRNRSRRVLRAALAEVLPAEGVGNFDLVLVARGSTAAQKSGQVAGQLRRLMKKAGLTVKDKEYLQTPTETPNISEQQVSFFDDAVSLPQQPEKV